MEVGKLIKKLCYFDLNSEVVILGQHGEIFEIKGYVPLTGKVLALKLENKGWQPYIKKIHGNMVVVIAKDYKVGNETMMQTNSKYGWGYQNKSSFLRKSRRIVWTPEHYYLL